MTSVDFKNISDQDLMLLVSKDDIKAWAEIVSRYANLAYAISYQVLRNKSDSEDAVQDTFINLKIYSNQFDSTKELKPWLSRVAANQAILIYKKRKKKNLKEINLSVAVMNSKESKKLSIEEIVEKKEVESLVRSAINTLPETSRVAMTLYFAGGLNQTEVAQELGLSQFSISEKIKNGLERVKSYLKKTGVQVSIVMLSTKLIKESIFSEEVPIELMNRISLEMPTSLENNKASNDKGLLHIINTKPVFSLSSVLLGIIVVFSGVYFLLPKDLKIELASPSEKLKNNNNLRVTKKFKPIDLSEFIPFDYHWTSKLGGGGVGRLTDATLNKWEVLTDELGKTKLLRDFDLPNQSDGFFLKNIFNKAGMFRGVVKINSEHANLYFSVSVPSNEIPGFKILNKENFISAKFSGQGVISKPIPKSETKFSIYIWPNDNKWKVVCLFTNNGKQMKDQDFACWIHYNKQQFALGIFSDANLELTDFEYCDLGDNWDPTTEPDLSYVYELASEDSFLLNK